MYRVLAAAAAVVLGAGCCSAGTADIPAPPWQVDDGERADPVSTFTLRSDAGDAVVLRADAHDVVGADVSLSRYEEGSGTAIRGRAFGRPVNVDVGTERVTGLAGARPLDLAVARRGGAIQIEGVVRGEPSRFSIDARTAQGTIARCSYALTLTDTGYEGRRSCGGPTAHVWLHVPTALDGWGDEGRAAVLAILLAGG